MQFSPVLPLPSVTKRSKEIFYEKLRDGITSGRDLSTGNGRAARSGFSVSDLLFTRVLLDQAGNDSAPKRVVWKLGVGLKRNV